MIADLIEHQKETVRQQFITYIQRAATESFFPYGDLARQLNGDDLLDAAAELTSLISLEEWREMREDLYDMVCDVIVETDPTWDFDDDDDREWARMISLSVDSLCRCVMIERWGCDH